MRKPRQTKSNKCTMVIEYVPADWQRIRPELLRCYRMLVDVGGVTVRISSPERFDAQATAN